MLTRLLDFLEWLGSHGALVLTCALLVVLGLWGFVELAGEVTEGDTQAFDERILLLLRDRGDLARPIGPVWMEEIGRDLTALGGIAVLAIVTFAVVGYLLMVRKFHAMWLVLIATLGGLLISGLLKRSFHRERPNVVPFLSQAYTSSFPSGHSMMSAVVYLTLGSLLTRLVPSRAVKVYFLALGMGVTILVGVSRVYMGVHYPSDVLAGWTAGLVWALLCWLVARRMQIRGAIEKDSP